MSLLIRFVAAWLALSVPVAAHAAWYEATSKHFLIYADGESAELKQFAEKLERFDAAVREARGVPDVAAGASMRVTLYVLRDIAALRQIYGDRDASVAGFYIPKSSGSVAFVPKQAERGKWGLSSSSIFFHEYSHHLMLQDADRPLPTWLTEGFAEFFANPGFNTDGSVVIGLPPRYRAESLYSSYMGLPLTKMLSGDYSAITAMEYESLYGRGWLLTHLLSFDLKRRGQLTRYLDQIQTGVPALIAAEQAFGDLKALDKQLSDYFKKDTFTVTTIAVEKLRPPPVALRRLSPGEEAVIDVKMRLARGGKKLAPKSLAGRARQVAAQYPADAAVQTVLAQAEVAAGSGEAASRAADRALELSPGSGEALSAKANAMLMMAKASPSTARWDDIRKVIGKANRIDPENAEPLMLFYRTFAAQGVPPTQNAMDGLRYAVTLAPQDNKLRMELIAGLIDHDRFADASRALIPLAYSPHQGKWHDAMVALMNEINASNKLGAKAKLQSAQKLFED